MRSSIWMSMAVTTAVLVACGEQETKPPVTPAAAQFEPRRAPAPPPPAAQPEPDVNRSTVVIAQDIRNACGISDVDAYFNFDSSVVLPTYQGTLRKLSDCFSTGPLMGRQMRLIGHADPRGDDEYNMLLGGRRANSVKDVIVAQGMNGAKIETSSRGEMDATGTEEQTWSKDRRVDILLGD